MILFSSITGNGKNNNVYAEDVRPQLVNVVSRNPGLITDVVRRYRSKTCSSPVAFLFFQSQPSWSAAAGVVQKLIRKSSKTVAERRRTFLPVDLRYHFPFANGINRAAQRRASAWCTDWKDGSVSAQL